VRDEDGESAWRDVAAGIHVDDSDRTPFVGLDLPLKPAIPRFPGYQESAAWSVNGISLSIIRPGFLADGVTMTTNDGAYVEFRSGIDLGAEVQIGCSDSVQDAASLSRAIADSLAIL
jgi:hypothetical protein